MKSLTSARGGLVTPQGSRCWTVTPSVPAQAVYALSCGCNENQISLRQLAREANSSFQAEQRMAEVFTDSGCTNTSQVTVDRA